MSQSYNQLKAMLAITKGSFRAMLRSPSSVVFSIFFPLIFILVFGFIGGSGGVTYKIVIGKKSDTTNALYHALQQNKFIRFVQSDDPAAIASDLAKGRLTGVLTITRNSNPALGPYSVQFSSTTASADKFGTFLPLLENTINKLDKQLYPNQPT